MQLSLYFPQLLLLGDSITQESAEVPNGIAPALQKEYVRKYDVVNRGFTGYNTEDYHEIIGPVLNGVGDAPIDWSVVFLGNEDAQTTKELHVPLSSYSANLESIATAALDKSNNVVIVGQGIVDEDRANATNKDFYLYNRAARSVAKELDVPFVDLWSVFRTYLNESGSLNPFTFGSNGSGASNTSFNLSGAANRTGGLNATFADSSNSTNLTAPANSSLSNSSSSSNSTRSNSTSSRTNSTRGGRSNSSSSSSNSSSSSSSKTYIGAKGNPENSILATLFTDGLHFTDLGYQLYFQALNKVLNVTNATQVLPDYQKINSTEVLPNALVEAYVSGANATAQRWLNISQSS